MLTTCPECRTTFRVGQEQLDDKRGLVRCGHCAAVFNAYDTLLPELSAPPVDKVEREQDVSEASPPELVVDLEEEGGEPEPNEVVLNVASPSTLSIPEEFDRTSLEAPLSRLMHGEDGLGEAPDLAPVVQKSRSDDILFTPLSIQADRDKGRPLAGFLWGLSSLLLVLFLVLQLAYFMRAELVTAFPDLQLASQRLCAHLGCDLPLAKDLSALRIESTSLETDPEDKFRAMLHVTLSNRSDQPVAWPHLVLMLTDTRDLPIAQRPFEPGEYLSQSATMQDGMAPGHELEVQLPLELKGLSAYGYKLDIQYP